MSDRVAGWFDGENKAIEIGKRYTLNGDTVTSVGLTDSGMVLVLDDLVSENMKERVTEVSPSDLLKISYPEFSVVGQLVECVALYEGTNIQPLDSPIAGYLTNANGVMGSFPFSDPYTVYCPALGRTVKAYIR